MKKTISLMLALILLLSCMVFSTSAASVKAGQTVYFGTYEQDNDTCNGQEKIEWIVLEVKDDSALLISKYILDAAVFHNKVEDVTWETSDLRDWLNDDFLYTAFTSSERSAIKYTNIHTPKSAYGNKTGGNDTTDKVFCLSVDEANHYFKSNSSRTAEMTKYAAKRAPFAVWWLRSPGGEKNSAKAVVDQKGQVCTGGNWVTNNDTIRPCIWVDLSK